MYKITILSYEFSSKFWTRFGKKIDLIFYEVSNCDNLGLYYYPSHFRKYKNRKNFKKQFEPRLQKIMQLLTAMIYHVAFEHFFSTTIPAFLQFEWKIVGYREIALTTCP